MTDTTTRNGWPFPEGTDRVTDGAAAIQALAEAIDDDWPTGPDSAANTTGGTVETADAWTTALTGSSVITASVTVPASGRVLVVLGAEMVIVYNGGAPSRAAVGVRLNGAGLSNEDPPNGAQTAALEVEQGTLGSAVGVTVSRVFTRTGLTPGATLTATMVHKTQSMGHLAGIDNRRVELVPLP